MKCLPSNGSYGTESGHSLSSLLRQTRLFVFNQGLSEEHEPAAVPGQKIREWPIWIIYVVIDSAAVDTEISCGLSCGVQLFWSYVRFFVSRFHVSNLIIFNQTTKLLLNRVLSKR